MITGHAFKYVRVWLTLLAVVGMLADPLVRLGQVYRQCSYTSFILRSCLDLLAVVPLVEKSFATEGIYVYNGDFLQATAVSASCVIAVGIRATQTKLYPI